MSISSGLAGQDSGLEVRCDDLLREHQAAQAALMTAVAEVDQRRADPLIAEPPIIPAEPKRFDRKAYMREYMRKRSAKKEFLGRRP